MLYKSTHFWNTSAFLYIKDTNALPRTTQFKNLASHEAVR